VNQTNIPSSYVDEVDEKILEIIEENKGNYRLTQEMDDKIADIFVAPSKHARDVYNKLWMEGLGNDYTQEQQVEVGAANQFHHNTSLIADDMMDQDLERRGQITFHNSELLTSNFPKQVVDSLTLSQVIKFTSIPYTHIPNSSIPEKHQTQLISSLAENTVNLVEGQNEDLTAGRRLDVQKDNGIVTYENEELDIPSFYYPMVDGKTGALFTAASETAMIPANYEGTEPLEHALEVGRVLQITDDILDYNSKSDKDHLSDLKNSMPTLVVHYGLKNTEGYEKEKLKEVLQTDEPKQNELYEAEEILNDAGAIERAYQDAIFHAEEAKRYVDEADLENPEYGQDLNNLVDLMIHRAN